MKSIEVTLGGRTHVINALTSRKAQEWRSTVTLPVEVIQSLLQSASSFDLTDPNNISALLSMVSQYIFKSPDLVVNLVMSYGNLPDSILDEAYDEEFFAAFVEVLKLAYPFGVLRTMFPGLNLDQMSRNLRSLSGESGETQSTTKQ